MHVALAHGPAWPHPGHPSGPGGGRRYTDATGGGAGGQNARARCSGYAPHGARAHMRRWFGAGACCTYPWPPMAAPGAPPRPRRTPQVHRKRGGRGGGAKRPPTVLGSCPIWARAQTWQWPLMGGSWCATPHPGRQEGAGRPRGRGGAAGAAEAHTAPPGGARTGPGAESRLRAGLPFKCKRQPRKQKLRILKLMRA